MVKIILAEDHLIVRNGIKLLLNAEANLEVIFEASQGEEVMDYLLSNEAADMLITDIHMEGMDGFALIKQVHASYPRMPIVVLSMVDDLVSVSTVFKAGASGYLLKNTGLKELLFAINHVVDGQRYICAELSVQLLDFLGQGHSISSCEKKKEVEERCSARELEILTLIASGFTNQQIADHLFLSKRTVEGHRQHLLEKTESKNTASLIKFAVKHGLVE